MWRGKGRHAFFTIVYAIIDKQLGIGVPKFVIIFGNINP
jgi:hypothetical protein